nr:DDE-type integrase/transposase/recombinase [Azospirillum brasilense]
MTSASADQEKHNLWLAVDQDGFVLDVPVQSRRDTKAAKRLPRKLLKTQSRAPRVLVTDKLKSYAAARRFFRKALKQAPTVNPRSLTVDKTATYPSAAKAMKKDGELWRFTKLRPVKYLNNIVEQDHRRITLGAAGARLQELPHRAPNDRRLRDPGDGAQGAGRRHARQRHARPGDLHRQPVRCCRLKVSIPRLTASAVKICNGAR